MQLFVYKLKTMYAENTGLSTLHGHDGSGGCHSVETFIMTVGSCYMSIFARARNPAPN